jgi:alpha-beta hydrolase superfamily lysophospholipase
MLAAMKLASMAAGLMLSSFQGSSAEAASYATPVHTAGAVTEYSIEAGGTPVLASWKAEEGQQKAIVLAIHGFGLHKYAFRSFAENMRLRGISTYALDIRGFGEWAHSAPSNQKLNLQKTLGDIKDTLQALRDENPETPIFLLGESMGGALALRAATDSPQLVAGVISSVPSGQLAQKETLALELSVKFLLSAGHRIDIGKHLFHKATADNRLAQQWMADSRVRMKVGKGELMQFSNFMSSNDKVAKSLSQTAVLIIQGKQDRLVRPAGTVRIFEELTTTDKSMVMVQDGEHLILEEGQFDDNLMNTVSTWLTAHSPNQNPIVASNR